MGSDNQAYFAQRAMEEKAAAERAACPAAESAHRELCLRYSLNVVRPGPARASDEVLIGRPKRSPLEAEVSPKSPARKRRRA